jgi:flagellar motor protein MotB
MSEEIKQPQNLGDAQTLTSLLALIITTLNKIKTLQEEVTETKRMKEDSYKNDVAYKEVEDKAKEATKKKMEAKSAITKQPQVMELEVKAKEGSQSIKELKESLSAYLIDYAKISGLNVVETPNGEVLEIRYSAKLVRSNSKKQ